MREMMRDYFEFLNESVSPFHAVEEAAKRLERQGFQKLEESGLWQLQKGGRYYTTRNQSSVIAFDVPEERPGCYHITASHSDSPTFRIKKNKAAGTYYARAEVEGYGGMIYSSWLDRPLTFAGRVVVRTADGLRTRLATADKDVFVIPNLSIHFNREVNKGYSYNPQIDLQPLYGSGSSDLRELIAECLGNSREEEIRDMDLVLAVRQKAGVLGVKDEFYLSPRIDDLGCAYTTLAGYLDSLEYTDSGARDIGCGNIRIWAMFDNEEVGSGTRQGAMGDFLPAVLERIENQLGLSVEESRQIRSRSLLVSADNAHALHPNLPDKSDREFPIILNQGIVIKYNASQKYTTTGMTAAVFEEICRKKDIPVQHFANRADAPGGSTLGNLLSHQLSIPMLDIGLPQLAMHSAVETAGCEDVLYMKRAVQAFYESGVYQERDGEWKGCN